MKIQIAEQTIETRFNIGDTVYYNQSGVIQCGIVAELGAITNEGDVIPHYMVPTPIGKMFVHPEADLASSPEEVGATMAADYHACEAEFAKEIEARKAAAE